MDVVEQVAAAAVDVTNYITVSDAASKAFQTATLLKTLSVNALIIGEEGVGKKSLAQYILPDALVVDASDFSELLLALESEKELIITNIETSPNMKRMLDTIAINAPRIIATSKQQLQMSTIDEIFSVKFDIPPLRERLDDVEALIEKFAQEASSIFGSTEKFNTKDFKPDLLSNAVSLKRQVMINYLLQDIKDSELMEIIESYLAPKLGSNSDYRSFLYLYEVPLIRAGLKMFKSQLQLSDRLGLNRNTLRKKIADHKQYLQGDKDE